jgi:hypothetical protein
MTSLIMPVENTKPKPRECDVRPVAEEHGLLFHRINYRQRRPRSYRYTLYAAATREDWLDTRDFGVAVFASERLDEIAEYLDLVERACEVPQEDVIRVGGAK